MLHVDFDEGERVVEGEQCVVEGDAVLTENRGKQVGVTDISEGGLNPVGELLPKDEVQIFDFVDFEVPMLRRMFERRLRGYRAIGYSPSQGLIGDNEPDEPIVDYDGPAWD